MQRLQSPANAFDEIGPDAARMVVKKEVAQHLAAETAYHERTVKQY